MITTLLIIGIAFYWLMIETNWLTIRLPMGKALAMPIATDKPIAETQVIKLLSASKPMLALPVGNPDNYPMTLTIEVNALRKLIAELSATELELTEEVLGYDYNEQA